MREWTYFISIPLALTGVILFWYNLASTVNSGTFDALPAWIIAGIACHGALVGLSYHCYRTVTGTWIRPKKK